MPPLRLSDDQLSAVWQAAKPLAVDQRGPFLEALAAELRGQGELGDGAIYRAIRAVQRRYFDPPLSTSEPHRATRRQPQRASSVIG
jgi:hypothetical protein